ncbi:hypothetical protein DFS34DRAFT_334665 [Phlyctochytrium arcticum]|nr:hypothetical protein DFS34DRAFT_334665 [Phlyctochytrium arcticum]
MSTPNATPTKALASTVANSPPAPSTPKTPTSKLDQNQITSLLSSFSFSFSEAVANAAVNEADLSGQLAREDDFTWVHDVEEAGNKLRRQCEILEKQIQEVQESLSNAPVLIPTRPDAADTQTTKSEAMQYNSALRMAVLQTREKALLAEIAVREKGLPRHMLQPESAVVQQLVTAQEVFNVVSEYRDSNGGLAALEAELEHELNQREIDQRFERVLEDKYDILKTQLENSMETSEESRIQEILGTQADVITRLETEIHDFEDGLRSFLLQHYPTPVSLDGSRKRPLEKDPEKGKNDEPEEDDPDFWTFRLIQVHPFCVYLDLLTNTAGLVNRI